jgi:hypothetical protein
MKSFTNSNVFSLFRSDMDKKIKIVINKIKNGDKHEIFYELKRSSSFFG